MDKEKLTAGTRVVLDMTTLTIMRALPREVSFFAFLLNMIGSPPVLIGVMLFLEI